MKQYTGIYLNPILLILLLTISLTGCKGDSSNFPIPSPSPTPTPPISYTDLSGAWDSTTPAVSFTIGTLLSSETDELGYKHNYYSGSVTSSSIPGTLPITSSSFASGIDIRQKNGHQYVYVTVTNVSIATTYTDNKLVGAVGLGNPLSPAYQTFNTEFIKQ